MPTLASGAPTANSLLAILRRQGVNFYAENDVLHYCGPKGLMTDQLLATLKERKQEIIALLREDNLVRDEGQL